MNRENFSEYIEEPSKLYQLSYQELKSLVLQHPYCANLHVLLLQKAQLDNSTAFSKNLEKAAVHTFDRAYLYDLIKSQKLLSVSREEFAEFEDEILELQDINSLEEKVEKIPLVANENDSSTGITREAAPVDPPNPQIWENEKEEEDFHLELDIPDKPIPSPAIPETEFVPPPGPADIFAKSGEQLPSAEESAGGTSEVFLISEGLTRTLQSYAAVPGHVRQQIKDRAEKEEQAQKEQAKQEKILADLRARLKVIEKEVGKEVGKASTVAPQSKKQFNSWKRQLTPRKLPRPSPTPPQPPPAPPQLEKKEPPVKVSVIAKRSLEDQVDIASETLADLLVKQQQYPKAIDMYERLKLKFPQKSVYFAGKIEELIKLM